MDDWMKELIDECVNGWMD